MISTYRSLSTGTKRAIIVGGILSSLFAGGLMTDFDDEWLAVALIICVPVYCVLVAMGLWVYSGYNNADDDKNGEIGEMADAVRGSIESYRKSKREYEEKSKVELLDIYSEMKRESKEDMERLALEDALVERGMIDESKMRKKAQNIKNKMFNSNR